ncbi:MAG TPA: hypothetical protein VM073_01295 [Usitatibacter sp.]|nr:hypothetical protein [Usitatibacter sp.]
MNKPNNTRAIAIATVAAICLMAGLARADDGGAEDHMIPAAFIGDEGSNGGNGALSCKDLGDAAWFNHEIERSDGEVSPAAPAVDCRPDVYAEFTVDAD